MLVPRSGRLAALVILLLLSAILPYGLMSRLVSAADPAAPSRLLVLVVFDQFRGDFLDRWDELFGQDGFRRLERKGTWFTNCYYPYAGTITGPGHASLLTGCSPDR